MSDDDQEFGRPGINREAGYVEMSPDPRVPKEPDDNTTYDDVDHAFDEVQKARGKVEREPLVERAYVTVGTDDDGTPRPRTETITVERAADDLARIRSAEVDAIVAQEDRVIADTIDEVQGRPTQTEQEAALAQWQAHQAQLAAQQAQAEPLPEGVDREVFEALKNPRVAAALSAELAKVEESRRAFATAAFQSAQLGAAAVLTAPELQGIPPEQISVALHLIEKQNPHRALEIRSQLQNVQRLYEAAQQAKAQEQQIQVQQQQARLQSYKAGQDVLFEHSLKSENPETVKQVKSEIMGIIENDYGISRDDLAQAVRTNPALHSAAFQKMMYDAAKYKLAQRTATANPARAPLPPVQKPGVSRGGYYDSDVESAKSEFLKRPTARSAAAFIASRRRSA